jgi:site-specific DNA-methyltransferase (adenine-specific)
MGTVAQNVLKYGVGGLNIDESRVGDEVLVNACAGNKKGGNSLMMSVTGMPDAPSRTVVGRWPANLIHDGSPDVLSCFPKDEHRFFYTAKASKSDRGTDNTHPTVKPTALMEYLCKLVGPPGCTILDPMMGSGSTGVAAKTLGYNFVGIEMHPPYFQIAERRISEARHAFV